MQITNKTHSGKAILTKQILDADQQNIPKGKLQNKNILPKHIHTKPHQTTQQNQNSQHT